VQNGTGRGRVDMLAGKRNKDLSGFHGPLMAARLYGYIFLKQLNQTNSFSPTLKEEVKIKRFLKITRS
jgi:hypothetical protein